MLQKKNTFNHVNKFLFFNFPIQLFISQDCQVEKKVMKRGKESVVNKIIYPKFKNDIERSKKIKKDKKNSILKLEIFPAMTVL